MQRYFGCPAVSSVIWTAWSRVAILVLIVLAALSQPDARAAQLTFLWDYSASGAAGFVLYCGPSSLNYTTRVDVGNTETYVLTGLAEGATYHCAVTAYDPAKVESPYSNEISVVAPYAAPSAGFSASPMSGIAPLSVAFTNTTTGSLTSWAWTFGDGTSSTAQNPTHVYNAAGSYTVKLTVTGPGGSSTKTAATPISVRAAAPVASGRSAAVSLPLQ